MTPQWVAAIGALPIALRLGSAPSEIIPKASIERPGASKGLQFCLQKISFSFSELRIINGLRANGGQKIAERAVGRTLGSRLARRTVLTRESAFGARRPGHLDIPPLLSIQILACRRLIDFEAALRSPRDASLRRERIVNVSRSVCQEKSLFYTSQAGGSAISTFSAALMPQGARRRRWPTQDEGEVGSYVPSSLRPFARFRPFELPTFASGDGLCIGH